MKRRIVGWAPIVGLLAVSGCAIPERRVTSADGITTLKVIGTEGMHVTGHYVQNGYLVPIAQPLPFALAHAGISELELRKDSPNGALYMAGQYDDQAWHSEVMNRAGEGISGLRVRVDDGLVVEKLKP